MALRCPVCGFDLIREPDVEVDGIVLKSVFFKCRFCDVLYLESDLR